MMPISILAIMHEGMGTHLGAYLPIYLIQQGGFVFKPFGLTTPSTLSWTFRDASRALELKQSDERWKSIHRLAARG